MTIIQMNILIDNKCENKTMTLYVNFTIANVWGF